MIPCSPPIAFCSTVGHAIFQTAGAIGPSTMRPIELACPGARQTGGAGGVDATSSSAAAERDADGEESGADTGK